MRWETSSTIANQINNGNMYEEGDILTSHSLNVIVTELLAISDLMRSIYGEAFIEILRNGLAVNWVRTGTELITTIDIPASDFLIFAQAHVPPPYVNLIEVLTSNPSGLLRIRVRERLALRTDPTIIGTRTYLIPISFFADQAGTRLIARKTLTVRYSVPPTQPVD
ncbi:MAG: hypothetical protein FWE36_06840 [Erysipelotrichales bacterium]|nr:hypothetical protein [Erysipelotrichales bacterium]